MMVSEISQLQKDIYCMISLEIRFLEMEGTMEGARAWGRVNGDVLFNRSWVSV